MRKIKYSLFGILIFSNALFADTVHLVGGGSISGQIVGQTRTAINVKTPGGNRVVLINKVVSVKFGITKEEKDRQAARRKEIAQRYKKLAEARRKKQTQQINQEQKRLALLKKQAELEVEALKKRAQKVLSVEEEIVRLSSEEKKLKKRLADVQRKRAQLEGKATPLDYLWRSAVLPGWGQLHAAENLKGYGWMAGTLATGAYALLRYKDSLQLQRDYQASQNLWNGYLLSNRTQQGLLLRYAMPQSEQSALNAAEVDVYNFSILTGLLYAANLFDAYFLTGSASVVTHNFQHADGIQFRATITGNTIRAGFAYKY